MCHFGTKTSSVGLKATTNHQSLYDSQWDFSTCVTCVTCVVYLKFQILIFRLKFRIKSGQFSMRPVTWSSSKTSKRGVHFSFHLVPNSITKCCFKKISPDALFWPNYLREWTKLGSELKLIYGLLTGFQLLAIPKQGRSFLYLKVFKLQFNNLIPNWHRKRRVVVSKNNNWMFTIFIKIAVT